MLIADKSVEFHREPMTRPRFLRPERREVLLRLQAQLFVAFAGIERGAPEPTAVRAFYVALFRAVFASFREAASTAGVAELQYWCTAE